jgi:hypothetical protein
VAGAFHNSYESSDSKNGGVFVDLLTTVGSVRTSSGS